MHLKLVLTRPESHLDFNKGFIAVSKQVLGLPVVDSHHAQQQVA